jgi:hypothetical protein
VVKHSSLSCIAVSDEEKVFFIGIRNDFFGYPHHQQQEQNEEQQVKCYKTNLFVTSSDIK